MVRTSTKSLDVVIRDCYRRYNTPVDQIVAYPDLGDEFAALVNANLPIDRQVDVGRLNWRLMTLRKRGEDKGGLPRLERAYYGRTTKEQPPRKPR